MVRKSSQEVTTSALETTVGPRPRGPISLNTGLFSDHLAIVLLTIFHRASERQRVEYYTLECILFALKNCSLPHPRYASAAVAAGVPVVRRMDWKYMLEYLEGRAGPNASIDRSATIEMPIPLSEVMKRANESSSDQQSSGSNLRASSEDGPSAAKIPRPDESAIAKAKEAFSEQLELRGQRKTASIAVPSSATGSSAENASTIADSLSIEKINAMKAKRQAKKREMIIDPETELALEAADGKDGIAAAVPSILFQVDSDLTREIQSRERIWRNRTTILQAAVKNFAKSIFPILQSIKNREEGGVGKKPVSNLPPPASIPNLTSMPGTAPATVKLATPAMSTPAGQVPQQYNRYDQERFSKNDPSLGFRIDTTGTYHGLTLKSVTAGPTPIPSAPVTPVPRPVPTQSNTPGSGQRKRTSRTPIIIIPATTTSLITMLNAKYILQELRFQAPNPSEKRENELLITRKKPDGSMVPYRVIDNHTKLQPDDWERVVAVFVQGPAWQFKGWPWDGNPVEIFARGNLILSLTTISDFKKNHLIYCSNINLSLFYS